MLKNQTFKTLALLSLGVFMVNCAKKQVQKQVLSPQATSIGISELNGNKGLIEELSANTGLPICPSTGKSKFKTTSVAGASLIDGSIANMEAFVKDNEADIKVFTDFINTFRTGLLKTLEDPTVSDENKKYVKDFLQLEESLKKIDNIKNLTAKAKTKPQDLHYVNSKIENQYPELIDFDPKQKNLRSWSLGVHVITTVDNSTHNVGVINGDNNGINITGSHIGNGNTITVGFNAEQVAALIGQIDSTNDKLVQLVTATLQSNQVMMNTFQQMMTAIVQDFKDIIMTLISSANFSPNGNTTAKAFVAGGAKSALILNTIARSGVQDAKTKRLAEIVGEIVEKEKLETSLEGSFFTDVKPMTSLMGYEYYYFYIAEKGIVFSENRYELQISPYVFRLKESDLSYQLVNATKLFDSFTPQIKMNYKNEAGTVFALQNSDFNLTLNELNYPVARIPLGINYCISDLDLGVEIASSKLFSARTGNYIYNTPIVE